jgi:hypothetical protein
VLPERGDELLAAYEASPEARGRSWDGEAAYRWVMERRRLQSGNAARKKRSLRGLRISPTPARFGRVP